MCNELNFGLMQEQERKQKKLQSILRKQMVESAINKSKECTTLDMVVGKFVPEFKRLVDEVSTKTRLIRSNVDVLAPYSQKFLIAMGCALELSEGCDQTTKKCNDDEIRTKISQVSFFRSETFCTKCKIAYLYVTNLTDHKQSDFDNRLCWNIFLQSNRVFARTRAAA